MQRDLIIGGRDTPPASGDYFDVVAPESGEVVGREGAPRRPATRPRLLGRGARGRRGEETAVAAVGVAKAVVLFALLGAGTQPVQVQIQIVVGAGTPGAAVAARGRGGPLAVLSRPPRARGTRAVAPQGERFIPSSS